MIEVTVAQERLLLLPQRGMHWPRTGTLIIADTHFGKASIFRQAGVPVPEATTQADLDRLSHMLGTTRAHRLIVLGDFFHGRVDKAHSTLALLEAWRDRHRDLPIVLVPGNHDEHAGSPPASLDINDREAVRMEPPFVFRHDPEADARGYVLAGHLHPGIGIAQLGATRSKVPCFHLGEQVGVLPAFGRFTGTKTVRPGTNDRIYAVGPGMVAPLSVAAVREQAQKKGAADATGGLSASARNLR